VVAIARLDENISDSLLMKYELAQRTEKLQDANEKLEHLTLVDSLTQLYNRRFLERQMEREWKKCHRESKRLALLVIDIDYFKLYNDSHGHAAGDECLKKVASTLASALNRPGDIIARIGGEEFVALLPGIDEEGAIKVAETMQQKLHDAQIPHRASPIDDAITVSIGLAVTYPTESATALGLFKAADKALYRGKFMGRNHIVVGELDMLDS
jgi:diguanylate cyclase (GGDEF)-like protein